MGIPVVVVTSGGLSVTQDDGGLPTTVAANGIGLAVTVVASGGVPMTLEGYTPPG
jgi:hypothetical protein